MAFREYKVQRTQVFRTGHMDHLLHDYMLTIRSDTDQLLDKRNCTYVQDVEGCSLFTLEDAMAWCAILEDEDGPMRSYMVVKLNVVKE
jgi:hypothetical protein